MPKETDQHPESAELKNLINAIPDGLAIIDYKGFIIEGNEALETITSYKSEEMVGKHFLKAALMAKGAASTLKTAFTTVLKGKKAGPVVFNGLKKDGTPFSLELHAQPTVLLGKKRILGIVRDVTDRVRDQESLFRAESQYRALFDGATDALFLVDMESGAIEEANPASATMLGYAVEELRDKPLVEISAEPEQTSKAIGQMIQGKVTSMTIPDRRFVRKDGSTVLGEITVSALKVNGKDKLLGAVRDVTERKLMEARLKESEQKLKGLLAVAPVLVWQVNDETGVTFISENVKSMFGYSPRDFYEGGNEFAWNMVHPDDREELAKNHAAAMEEGKPYMMTVRYRHKNGRWRWTQESGSLTEIDGRPQLVGASVDITERVLAEQAVAQEQLNFKRLFDESSQALALQDVKTGLVIRVNRALKKLFGIEHFTDKQVEGLDPAKFFASKQAEGSAEDLLAKIAEGVRKQGYYEGEILQVKFDGSEFPARVSHNRIELEGRSVIYVQVNDLTEQRQAERKAKSLERLKSRFISALSHVTKAPLGRIRWSVENIQSGQFGEVSEDESKMLNRILESEEEILRVVANMNLALDIERGSLVLNRMPASVVSVVLAAKKHFEALPENESVRWEENIGQDRIGSVELDSEMFRRALFAVIENSIKYSRGTDGPITVSVGQTGDRVRCEVTDHGIGIPGAEQNYIFDLFFRASNAQTKHANGVGLGLHIAKAIIEAHGGDIGFESEEGVKTKFWFTLPITGS